MLIDEQLLDDCVVLSVSGDLVGASGGRLRDRALKALPDGHRAVVCDLSSVRFATKTALSAFLVLADSAVGWPECPVIVSGASPEVLDKLSTLRVTQRLIMREGLPEALRDPGGEPEVVVNRLELAARRSSPRLARRFVAWQLSVIDEARRPPWADIVVSELVTNAVVHARTPLELRTTRRGADVRVAVRDGAPIPPALKSWQARGSGEHNHPAEVGPDALHGRGLTIVEAFATYYGVVPTTDGGKVVWCAL